MKPARFWSTASEEPFRAPCLLPPLSPPQLLLPLQGAIVPSSLSEITRSKNPPQTTGVLAFKRHERNFVIYKEEAEQQEVTISQQTNKQKSKQNKT